MQFQQLQYFVAVAETRHFTRAAEMVHVAQPSLSQQIKTLERELGADLFLRARGNITLTDAGEALLPLARERGIAVLANRPFQEGALTRKLERHPLPAWAGEIGCRTWAQLVLKHIVSHPAVTCAIPATTRVDHVRDNMAAAAGVLPDEALRRRIADHIGKL